MFELTKLVAIVEYVLGLSFYLSKLFLNQNLTNIQLINI